MIKSVTMYSVVCDRCGKTFIEEFNGIVAWLDEGTAKEQAMESEGAEFGDKGYLLGDCCALVKDIVPIPITQKILCKNKWEANDIDYDYSINDKLYFRAFPTDRKVGCIELEVYNNIAPSDSYDVCQDDFYLGDISYVHDLQHLLFGLGINHEMEV